MSLTDPRRGEAGAFSMPNLASRAAAGSGSTSGTSPAQHDIKACPQAEPTPGACCMQTLEQTDLVAHALAGFLPAEGQASAAW